MLNKLRNEIHSNAVSKGFYEKETEFGTKLMLIVSELGEALEAHRMNERVKKEHLQDATDHYVKSSDHFKLYYKRIIKGSVEEELADVLIRLLDLCGYEKIDIQKHVELKMLYNSMRPYKHGKEY